MNPAELLAEAKAAGVMVYRIGDRLRLRAPGPPDEDLRRRLREAATDLLPLVPEVPLPPPTPSDPEVQWRAEVMRKQLPPWPRPAPLLVARPERPYSPGTCISCGAPVKAMRCEPCREAVAQVVAEWQGGQ